MFSTVDFGSGFKVDNAIDQYTGFYEDEDFQSAEVGYGYDWVPNYIYYPHLYKRSNGPQHEPVTKACCKKPCNVETLIKYCPRRLSNI